MTAVNQVKDALVCVQSSAIKYRDYISGSAAWAFFSASGNESVAGHVYASDTSRHLRLISSLLNKKSSDGFMSMLDVGGDGEW